MLHPLDTFIPSEAAIADSLPDYWYEGCCPYTGQVLRLPRTGLARAIAQALIAQLSRVPKFNLEGKMYGVLLVQTPSGQRGVLKAFSGLLAGQSQVEGWVPSMPRRERVALQEAQTLAALDQIKQQLLELQQRPERQLLQSKEQVFSQQLADLSEVHRQRKQARQSQRQRLQIDLQGEVLAAALAALDEQSRQDGLARRRLKQQRDAVLRPLRDAIAQTDAQILALKRQRQTLSRQLQEQLHQTYWLTNFAGKSQTLTILGRERGLPTGTGDCCAPKLLQYAAVQGLTPLAMAEFWWGPARGDRAPGQFYGACEDRCQPIMGFLLSGLRASGASVDKMPSKSSQRPVVAELEVQNPLHLPFKHVSQTGEPDGLPRSAPLQSIPLATDTPIPAPGVHAFSTPKTLPALGVPILYEDAWLIVVDKPSGLLSVPGRYLTTQDSVLSRLRFTLPAAAELRSVHRLDQDTSGVLIQARDLETYRRLSRQFQGGQVQKRYEAILEKPPEVAAGHIDLPLTADLSDRPRQRVDRQQGKPSVTRFRVLAQERLGSRVEFLPLTGRTHQLRVHAADPAGLNSPILGDRLYGRQPHLRLHLHAESLVFQHPHTGQEMCLTAPVPF